MLVVETIAKIRRAYFAQRMTIKAIWRALRLARKVGRKVIGDDGVSLQTRGATPAEEFALVRSA
jgi:hypothetical protein